MDSIIEKIAREVMTKLKAESVNRGASYSPPQAAPLISRSSLAKTAVLITANFRILHQVLQQIRALIPRNSRLFLSDYLLEKIGSISVEPGTEICSSKNLPASEALKDVGELIIPSLSINSLSKAANLISDSYATQIISFALCDGVPVTVTDESLLDPTRYFPTGVAKKITQFRRELETMGVTFQRTNISLKPDPKCEACVSGSSSCTICQAPSQALSLQAYEKPREASSGSCKKANCTRSYGSCSSSCESSVREVIQAGADRIEKGHEAPIPSKDLACYIDHTLLKADATSADITKLCDEAKQYIFASVCVNPGNVALAGQLLRGTPVKVCTVVGFPLGATSTFTKVMETRDALANGATEIDMVINVGGLKSKDFEMVKNDIARVVEAAGNNTVKVILETSLLTEEEKIKGCELSKLAGADFVKTSTGFSSGGATVADIALMRRIVGPAMGVKASGGIRDTKTAQAMISAGATRVGASASVQIVKGEATSGKGY